MFRVSFIMILCLWGCQSPSSRTSKTLSELPSVDAIERPDNEQAAAMLDDYLTIMDEKMALAAEIGRISTRDKYVREVFIDMFSDPKLDPDVRVAFQKSGGAYVEAIDAINTAEIKQVMKGVTWRELATGEQRLAERAFHIVQHSNDAAFREATLSEIKPLAEEGLMDGQLYALMYDRVALKKGELQLYGTQTKCINGQYDVHRLSKPEQVDDRREKIGLQPIADYIEQNRKLYGPC